MNNQIICKWDGKCLQQIDVNDYIKNPKFTCNHNCIPIKCKNYILCNEQFPKMYINCWNSIGVSAGDSFSTNNMIHSFNRIILDNQNAK